MGYEKVKTYALTPTRKLIGKAVARGHRHSLAVECLKDPIIKRYLLKRIGVLVRNELRYLCSDSASSILRSQRVTGLKEFSWEKLLNELKASAPIFFSILCECTHTRGHRLNEAAVVGMCAAIILKHRYPMMCLVQKVLSLILYAGHTGMQVWRLVVVKVKIIRVCQLYMQVYDRLQKLNCCMSHRATTRLLTKVGIGHDDEVKGWRDLLTEHLVMAFAEVR